MPLPIPRLLRLASALLLFVTPATAQGGFQPGELVCYTPAFGGAGSTNGAVARIDPVTGQVTTLALLTGGSQSLAGSMTYDPFRDRVVFMGRLPTTGDPMRLWASDAAGNLTDLGISNTTLACMTAGSGGRIYMRGPTSSLPIQYIDAADQLRTLLDASGTGTFLPPHWDTRGMLYHAGLNALFVATHSGSPWSCGSSLDANLHRVRLSADGMRALSIDACASIPVDPAGNNTPVGLSWRPDGQLLVVVDSNSNAQQPRMSLVDPDSMAVTPFASNGPYTGAAATNAGTWSTTLGKAVVLDTFSDVLRAFDQGEVGAGTVIVPSQLISSASGSGEVATLIEIHADPCGDLIGTYCTAKTSSQGCLPTLTASGCPSASAPSGFTIQAAPVPPANIGIFIYSKSGGAEVPFQGGFLCVGPQLRRTPPTFAGGAAPCSGQYSLDFNAYVATGVDPLLIGGAVVHGQFWFRDPPDPVSGSGLSNGVTFTLTP